MKPTISDEKRQLLLDLLENIEEQIGCLSCNIEENQNINDAEWRTYEEEIKKLNLVLGELKSEIYFS
ncbi:MULTISPECIES: hypothetical protein [unclassified Bacillus (in: firmicutes)]|uniref:hypothetical protein n=1 Tax=unclassified Bacillus (in: firmicutes) TaxID=185979 RepID=UPI000C769B2E|nr:MULTISPECIES: hypothetical protein [unclassified Bacillus (in: firmicutes)]MDT0160458.1 hypothetical protein [Bacillus sp. AG4(2022)]PLR72175.1 hypothetical protein CYJ37_11505 [Bacillus sp. UMB0728]